MIIDANSKWQGAFIWHCEECRIVPEVLWIDDETLDYCTVDQPLRATPSGDIASTIHRARKIEWLWPSKVILINPIDDAEPEAVETNAVAKGQPA